MPVLNKCTSRSTAQSGFTLVELMVVLLISLLLVGGLLSVFSSNQQTSRVKNNLDLAQEAFRFASHSILQVVRLAGTNQTDGAFLKPDADNEFRVQLFNALSNDDYFIVDCLGQAVSASGIVQNRFFVEGGALRCADGDGNTATLVSGVQAMTVRYGISGPDQWVADNDYVLANEIDDGDWPSVSSIRITLTMSGSGMASQFVASARSHIVATSGGGGSGTTPPVSGSEDDEGGGGTPPSGGNGGDGSGSDDDSPADPGGSQPLPGNSSCEIVASFEVHQNASVSISAASGTGSCQQGANQGGNRAYQCAVTVQNSTEITISWTRSGAGNSGSFIFDADCSNANPAFGKLD